MSPRDPNAETHTAVPTPSSPAGPPPSAGATGGHTSDLQALMAAADGLAVVPGFAIECVLGRGGMGVVYKATQTGLNRTVALKMLLAGPFADPALSARFLLEAESVAALEHPNIVRVFAFGEGGGHPYLALEYIPGGTLAERIKKKGPVPAREAAELVRKLASAVAHAHSRGVVHRDIKPPNVLLTEDGEPRLADFGLAKVGRSELSVTGQILGTPSYMAPEQAAGNVREVGTAADVYALGAVLYHLLTGHPPFLGESVSLTLQKVLTEEPQRPRKLNAKVPLDLETICLKCLQKVPADRYQTADALAADLNAFLGGFPVAARPVGPIRRAWKWAKRRPVRTILLATLFVAGLTLGALVPRHKPPPPTTPARTGVWVERDPAAERAFQTVGQEAIVYKYSGGTVAFWLELTTRGQGPIRVDQARGDFRWDPENRGTRPERLVEGTFIWIRGTMDKKDGTEEWRVGHERRKTTLVRTGGGAQNFVVSVERVKDEGTAKGQATSFATRYGVWTSRKLDFPSRSASGAFSNPIPEDRPLCLQDIKGWAANSRESFGEQTGPPDHSIRLMCQVVNENDPPR